MKCPRCQHESPADAVFCQECGTRLEMACPGCGTANKLGAKFCKKCGQPVATAPPAAAVKFHSPESYTPKHLAEKILTSKAALEGERKQVTVLFADLKGSMELLANRDPEEAREILDPVLERMMEAVHRYEGTVNQVMGDGIMALFGAPLALEDHAVRACYAALRMQELVKSYAEEVRRTEGIPVQVRVGLNSGEVVVRSIGSDLHMDYTAVGQTTHIAARLEQMTVPGSVLISPATLALAEGYVMVKPLGPRPIKGLERPLEIYELVGATTVRSRFQAAAARGLTRFVGRESELDQLRQAVERARAGHGQVVAVVGEAGVGKSRLYWEFSHSYRAQGWLILESGSVSYGKATNYLPISELLRAYFQIEHADDARKIREKITGKLLSLDRQLEPCVPPILWLLDVPTEDESWERLDPPQCRQRVLDAVKHLLLRESQVQPLMVLFEDLHWIDAETQALLENLVESLPTARLLLLVNYRPEYSHGWGSKTYYRQLQIDPLPLKSAEALLDALLGSDAALASLKRLVIQRTEGNPFFVEESVRSLVETGVLAGERGAYRVTRIVRGLQVPATAQAMLAARIDRLAPEDKRLLQAAAVIGTDVPFVLLKAVAEEPEDRLRRGLAQLQATEFLYETRLFPDLEYTFRHALTHEVAYGSLLAERRREVHARIVGAIEAQYGDSLDEQVERLAHHALLGDRREKAVDYLRRAAHKAAARSALQDARSWFEQALGILDALPPSRSTLEQAFDIRLELRSLLTQFGESPWSLVREAETLAERLNDDRRRGRGGLYVMNEHVMVGELDEALVTGKRLMAIAQRLGDINLRIRTTSVLVTTHYFRGDYARVVELVADNLAAVAAEQVAVESGYLGIGSPPSIFVRSWLIMTLAELGRFSEAAAHEIETLRLAELTNHAFPAGFAHRAAAAHHLLKGDWAKARSVIERWLGLVRTGNLVIQLHQALTSSAWVLAQLGESGEALNRIREGEQSLERQAGGIIVNLGWAYHFLGRASLLLGRLDEARRLADRAVESTRSQFGFAAHVRHLLGDIAAHPDRFDPERGEAHYRQALALAEPRGMRPLVAHCHLGLAKLYRRTGKGEQAQEHLTTATTMYREMAMTYWLEQAEAELQPLT
jgi:class 3 adenylate cyclase/tetratricopeptide (TPR) repeat protein